MDNYHLSQQLVLQECKQDRPRNQNLMINGTIHVLLMAYQNSCEVMLQRLGRFLFVFLGGVVSLYINKYVHMMITNYYIYILSYNLWYHIMHNVPGLKLLFVSGGPSGSSFSLFLNRFWQAWLC